MKLINSCWMNKSFTKLYDCFHNDVVFNSPDFVHKIVGREKCVQSYIDFMNNSQILFFNEKNPDVDLFETSAIVKYEFEMKYEQNKKHFHEGGTDIYLFLNVDGEWKAIWRSMANLKSFS